MDEFEFPTLPDAEALIALSDDELDALLAEFRAAFEEARPLASTPEHVTTLASVRDSVVALAAEQTRRETVAAEVQAGLDALAADIVAETPPGDDAPGSGDGADPEGGEGTPEPAEPGTPEVPPQDQPEVTEPPAEGVTEPLAADGTPAPAAATPATIAQLRSRTPDALRPRVPATARRTSNATITAAADLPGVRPGSRFATMHDIAEAMVEKHRYLGRGGSEDRVPVAQFRLNLPDERQLSSDMSDRDVLAAISKAEPMVAASTGQSVEPKSLVAAGGLCAPTAGYYEQMIVAEAMRPVRDALANFGADRGGIRFNPPPHLADITSGVAVQTTAQDLAGSPSKGCFHIACNAIQEVTIDAIYSCLEFGNFGARTFPEAVEAWTRLAMALQARVAETHLLDGIATASTAVTSAGVTGGAREMVARLGQAAATMRSRNRTDPERTVRMLLPAWILDLAQSDNARTFTDNPGFIGASDGEIVGWLRSRGIEPSWYVDTKTGGGQIIAAQSAGVLKEYPTTALVYAFFEGSFLHLDGGTLDLGIVRDTTTIAANNFRVFTETFENVAFVGPESLEIALSLCPDGSTGAARTVTCPIVT